MQRAGGPAASEARRHTAAAPQPASAQEPQTMTARTTTPALVQLLRDIPQLVPLGRIDQLWVFPPRTVGEVESGLVVLALRPEEGAEPLEVVTVQYEVRAGKGAPPPGREVASRGWAPASRVPGMIAGVVRRLGGEEEEPLPVTIHGEEARWNRFVDEVSDGVVDPANGE